MTMGPIQKMFLVLRPFEGALICSILIAGTQVMLRKAYFLRRGSWLRPKSWTPRPRIQNPRTHQRTYVENFSSLGACLFVLISVELIFLKMCSKKLIATRKKYFNKIRV
jgi:hypothetical protein